MKHGSNTRRGRSRGNGKRHSPTRNNFESNGPEVKVRGTAQQVLDKYLTLARDAASAGDRILSEGYFQFAEHYYRLLHADRSDSPNGQGRSNRRGGNGPSPGTESQPAETPANADAQPADEGTEPEPASA